MAKKANPIEGRWRIVSMSAWEDGYLDEEVQAFIEFEEKGSGSFQFGYVISLLPTEPEHRTGDVKHFPTFRSVVRQDRGSGSSPADSLRDQSGFLRVLIHHDEVRREILCRYVGIVAEGDQAFRLLHQNQAAVNTMASAKSRGELFKERLHSLVDLLTGPDAPTPERVRAAMTLGGISVGWMFFADQVSDRRALSDLVRSLACDFAQVAGEDTAARR